METNKVIEIIARWRNKYLTGMPKISFNYASISGNFLGYCKHDIVAGDYEYVIYIDKCFSTSNLTTLTILWHEFAHVMDYEYNFNGGHDKGWLKCWMKKPLLTIPMYVICLPNIIYQMIKQEMNTE